MLYTYQVQYMKPRLGALTDRHDVHGQAKNASGVRGVVRVTPSVVVGGGTPLQRK